MFRGIFVPGQRLAAAAELVAAPLYAGEIKELHAIDVGTDHAYLAVYLIQKGYCSHVTATDLPDGPILRARENIKNRTLKGESLAQYIDVIQTDGLFGLEHLCFERVAICGMGGEVICSILQNAAFLHNENKKVKIVLQPQSCEYELREYLYHNGFRFVEEMLIRDKSRIYTILAVTYDGIARFPSEEILLLGEKGIQKNLPLFETLLLRRIESVKKRLSAKKAAGLAISFDDSLYTKLLLLKEELTTHADHHSTTT
jgi:Predicted SAM-dependent methyltransferase